MVDTSDRVQQNTSRAITARIQALTDKKIEYYREHIGEIDERLEALDREWDIERLLQVLASGLVATGLLLGLKQRKLLVLPAVVTGLILVQATHGWSPTMSLLRRYGFRSAVEIQNEKYRLIALVAEGLRSVAPEPELWQVTRFRS